MVLLTVELLVNVTSPDAERYVSENVSVTVPLTVDDSGLLMDSLSVSHSTSRRHATYPRLFPRSGLHRPPSAALRTPHQWHSSAPSHTSRRQISPPHDAAHRSRASSPRATQYSTLPGAPHHPHCAWIDCTWQIPGSSGATVGHSVWQLRGLSVQYPSSGHHLQSALAVHTPLPSGSSDAGVHVGQHVPAVGWHTPIDVLDGHHWHCSLASQTVGSAVAGRHVGQHVPAFGWHTPMLPDVEHHWQLVLQPQTASSAVAARQLL
jgi:hypothetical protein